MGQLLVQKPNRRIPVIRFSPYILFYQWGQNKYDRTALEIEKNNIENYYDSLIYNTPKNKSNKRKRLERKKNRKASKLDLDIKEGNLLMRWGEPLAVYDSASTIRSEDKLLLYLQSNGYFNANIETKVRSLRKRVYVKYNIEEGVPFTIDTVYSIIRDTTIAQLMRDRRSIIRVDDRYEQDNLTDERNNITNYLKDHGYYDFSRQYIKYEVDTTVGNHKVAIRYLILNPPGTTHHKIFKLDTVRFVTDSQVTSIPDSTRNEEIFNEVYYRYHQKRYKPKILDRRVFLYPDEVYSRSNTLNTQRQLANLDVFKFINVNYDTANGQFIANIFTRPLPRYQWTNEIGVNVTQGFPGPFYNTTFRQRNVFHGLENFDISGRIGFEGATSASDNQKNYSSEIGINASLTFPQFVMPFSKKLLSRIGSQNPKTRYSVGYSLTDRQEYKRNNINFAAVYSWQKEQHTFYNLSVADISVINSSLTEGFEDRLDSLRIRGSNLYKSFEPSFVSSVIMQASRSFNNYGSGKSKAAFLRVIGESGGISHFIVSDSVYARRGLETYQFVRLNIDFRRTRPLLNLSTVALRWHAGVAIPYGYNKTLPYEKYFFSGGSNSIRGWRPRRLGPGSYNHIDSETGELSYQNEQQGEVLLEASIELRQNLVGFVDWAFFLDAGNIWTLEDDISRPGAKFEVDRFFKEIALATGLGLRLDFSFLIIRFDAGLKIYDPARDLGNRFILSDGYTDAPFDNRKTTEPIILNIGIGYPF